MLEVRLSCGTRHDGDALFDSHQACPVLMQVKHQIVLSATEAAEMILRVDDIIKVMLPTCATGIFTICLMCCMGISVPLHRQECCCAAVCTTAKTGLM